MEKFLIPRKSIFNQEGVVTFSSPLITFDENSSAPLITTYTFVITDLGLSVEAPMIAEIDGNFVTLVQTATPVFGQNGIQQMIFTFMAPAYRSSGIYDPNFSVLLQTSESVSSTETQTSPGTNMNLLIPVVSSVAVVVGVVLIAVVARYIFPKLHLQYHWKQQTRLSHRHQ